MLAKHALRVDLDDVIYGTIEDHEPCGSLAITSAGILCSCRFEFTRDTSVSRKCATLAIIDSISAAVIDVGLFSQRLTPIFVLD